VPGVRCRVPGQRSELRCGGSVAATRGYLRHLSIAKGSLAELETQILAGRAVAGIPEEDIRRLLALCRDIGRMLNVLYRKLKAKLPTKASPPSEVPARSPSPIPDT
jgi:hypothetical protein